MKTLTAKINTKSNFRDLNGTELQVTEINKKRVTCKMFDYTIQKWINVDFTMSEVELKY